MNKPKANIHPVKATANRYHGQILTCGYGHKWPLSFYTEGFVKIRIYTTPKGRVKMDHDWFPTRAEAQAAPV